ncbi:HlyD family type I secretion periplasmic adaptor subunit [Halarcobacter sp.]|uniref:HlyD family type I secretion periplasmic adaptor subunit n=1 Tax=Halarcobacter sp. TaxID=2321133 RepID=UPI0029F506C6|nr:HlyD family type I secretion periplasmic adaptor subunit [Halarcobacter sp.]
MSTNAKMPSHDASKIITFGLSVIFVVFGILGGWMFFAPLAASSVAMGTVSADLNKKVIQHLEGGIVKEILVKDGDKVKKGDLLIKLDDIQYKSQLNILKSKYQDALGAYARTVALENGKNEIVFPEELTDQNVITNQRNIFETLSKSQKEQKDISKNRIIQLQKQIDGSLSELKSKKQRFESISDEIEEWEELLRQKLIDKLKVRELKREKNSLEGDVAKLNSEIARLREQIEEVKIQQLVSEKDFRNQNLDSLLKAKSELEDLKSKIQATEDKLERTNIYSPINGVVVGLKIHTLGAVIAPGDNILEVVPEDSKLIVVAQVKTTDIDKVKVGLHADIRFSAFNLKTAHVIDGQVIHVSADSFTNQETGDSYYEAKIEVTKQGVKDLQNYGFTLVSGMPAEVMINIGERTAFSYLLKPITDMFTRGFNEE